MRYHEIINEKISTPYAFEVYDLIEDCAKKCAGKPKELRALLEDMFTKYFSDKLHKIDVLNKAELKVIFKSDVTVGAAGAFHHPNSKLEDLVPQIEPVPEDQIVIYVFTNDEDLDTLANPSYGFENAVRSLGQTLIHEFVHAIQWSRAKKFDSKVLYYGDNKRNKVDGIKHGKKNSDLTDFRKNPMGYYSTDIEIDAHASSAASEIIHRIRKEPPEKQKAELNAALRSLRVMSGTVMNYRETFKKSFVFFAKVKNPEQQKKMKANVWNRFRLKLAKHLMEYLKTI